ncbi:hypothetical protein PV326_005955 [Microctonus aethiopoides]|nr:hypothetical protein PV326_005955 [Microctonus aethiopoides]
MAPWDSKIRWQFGGNLQRVRLICELNWRECPLAIANYIWSEIVTDVVECVTSEGTLLRIIILVLVCIILLLTIWSQAQWISDRISNKDCLNRIDFKVQDLELRVNVLTYKMQYGTWPLPQQINGTNVEGQKDNMRLSLSSLSSRNSWLNRCIDSGHMKNRHISRSENLGLRLRRPKTLIETSKKIYYKDSSAVGEMNIVNSTSDTRKKFDKLNETQNQPKKLFNVINNDKNCHSTKETEMSKSIMKKHSEKKRTLRSERNLNAFNRFYMSSKSIYNNVPVTTTGESSCEDSVNPLSDSSNIISKSKISSQSFTMKNYSTLDFSTSSKQINSTQETLADVKERLEKIHTVLKTYGSQTHLKSPEKENIKEELTRTFIPDCDGLMTETKKINENIATSCNIISQPTESNSIEDQPVEIKIIPNKSNQNNGIVEIDEGKNSQVTKKIDEVKSPVSMDTDEDLGSISSQPEPSKGGSDSDKSTQSSDALMLSALLNQIDLSNLKRWNNKSTMEKSDDDSDGECIFPQVKSFCQSKLLDIISEEQSGSSCTEKSSKIISYGTILSKNNISLQNSSDQIDANNSIASAKQHIIEKNIDIESKNSKSDIEDKDITNLEVDDKTNLIIKNYELENNENVPKLLETAQTKDQTAPSITSPRESLITDSSGESIDDDVPSIENLHWKLEGENVVTTSNDINNLNNSNATENTEQSIDILNATLKRKPGVFFIAQSPNNSEMNNEITKIQNGDLIDLNFDDNQEISKSEKLICNDKFNVPTTNLIDTSDVLTCQETKYLSGNVLYTNQTVTCSNKLNKNDKSLIESNENKNACQSDGIFATNSCKNIDSNNLIELERITFEELTQVENSWDTQWTLKNSYDDLSITEAETLKDENNKFRSYNKKSSPNILSSPSSIYLTVQDSFSDSSTDSNPFLESIEKFEVPEKVKNINRVEKQVVEKTDSFIIVPKLHSNYNNKSTTHGEMIDSNYGKDNEDEECTVTSKDSALSETPQPSVMAIKNYDSNDKFMNAEIMSVTSSTETSSYVDASSHNLMCSSGISLSFDRSELTQSLDKPSSLTSRKSSKNTSVNSIKSTKEKNTTKNIELKTLNKTKMNNKTEKTLLKTKSNLNLTRENSMNLSSQKSDKCNVEFSQRRSKSYITPRKHKILPSNSRNSQDASKIRQQNSITKLNNCEMNSTNSKNDLIFRRSSSNIKFNRSNSMRKSSHESVNKSTSKSCIPVLKTRLDTTKNTECRSKSPLRVPLTKFADIKRNTIEKSVDDKSLHMQKNNNSDNEIKISHEKTNNMANKKNPLTAPEGQTVIYVNIVTDHDNCVTKVLDPKKFLECVKDKDLNIQKIVNENSYDNRNENNEKESINTKFLTVISSTGRNPMTFHQREMEVLAKPSVTNMSTSISDLQKSNALSKELSSDEYILSKNIKQPFNSNQSEKNSSNKQ